MSCRRVKRLDYLVEFFKLCSAQPEPAGDVQGVHGVAQERFGKNLTGQVRFTGV